MPTNSSSQSSARSSTMRDQSPERTPSLKRATYSLRTGERLVLDPVRLECLGAAGLAHPVGVLAPRAFEPRRLAVALEGEDVRRNPVEEPAVVGDDHRAAGEVEQRLLERA